MKKSLRILSLVLSVVLIMGSMSVLGSAYSAYKGVGNVTFDDANIATFTTDQYASMALDEVDRMLAKEQIVVDIYVGTLNLSSVDGTVTSINSLLESVGSLLNAGLLGDASVLTTAVANSIKDTKRADGDLGVIWDVLDLIGELKPILVKYVAGSLDLGVLNSMISDYVFNVRELVLGLLYGATGLGDTVDANGKTVKYDYMTSKTVPAKYTATGGPMALVQDLLNTLVVGKWQKLDDLFYETGHKTNNVSYTEYEFHDGSASGADVSAQTLDTTTYDYYGYVHEKRWVTNGLGDAIRVANGATAPSASYSKINVTTATDVYDFVEPLMLYAYNNILVPVLNRITKNWIREKCGYTFDKKYTQLYLTDENGDAVLDANGEQQINPDYDYLYGGVAPTTTSGDKIFSIFDVENFKVPKATVTSGNTFIEDINRIATLIIPNIIKATCTHTGTGTTDGDVYTYTWTDSSDTSISYTFNWTYGPDTYLVDNVCNLLKFILKVTGNEFFAQPLINKQQVKTVAQVDALTNQQLVAYILRSVINANASDMWIAETSDTQSIVGVAFEAVSQWAYQYIPQFTYTKPASGTTEDYTTKTLSILMDIAAYHLNAVLDTNISETPTDTSTTTSYLTTNDGTTNKTGLIGYLGDGGTYGTSAAQVAKWAVTKYTQTSQGNILSGLTLGCAGSTVTEANIWSDLDLVINSIIPIKSVSGASTSKPDNRSWISKTISDITDAPISKSFVFNYFVYPVLELNISPILEIFTKNTEGALANDSIEVILVDTIHRIADLLFPSVFSNDVNTIDGVLNNTLLSQMVGDLAITLSATKTATGDTNGAAITGRGKVIAEFALPIVCMILGLSDSQEFNELENYIPEVISAADNSTTTFKIYNASSGVNTGYRDANYIRQTDQLYTYKITSATCKIMGTSSTLPISGITAGTTTIGAGSSKDCTITGYTTGQMLETTIKYKVLDENGAELNNGTPLVSISYSYVGTKGDDEVLTSQTIGSTTKTISYPTDIYVSGGLSSVENYAMRIKDDSNGSSATATINSVTVTGQNTSWIVKNDDTTNTTQTITGQGATYVFTPFKVDDNANRPSYEYTKDADGNVVYSETTGLPTRASENTFTSPAYKVPYGTYTVTTAFTIAGTATSITTRVHVYDNFGLPSLLNNAISANRASDTITSAGQGYFTNYYNALVEVAQFVLIPNCHGASFDSFIATSSTTYLNKFEELYAKLFEQIKIIKQYEISTGADTLWTAVNNLLPYNYTRTSGTFGTSTAYYKDWAEYYDTGYGFVGQRNYVGVTYRSFKDAVERANSLINKEYRYINYTPEDYAKLTADEQTKALTSYTDSLEDVTAISSVEAAYATHLLTLRYSRLISLGAGNNSKLQSAITNYGGVTEKGSYTNKAWLAYTNAKTFAASTVADATSVPERIDTATKELIIAWKNLETGADYTQLSALITTEKAYIAGTCAGWGLVGYISSGDIDSANLESAATSEETNVKLYSATTYLAYLKALDAGQTLVQANTAGNGLGTSGQSTIDNAVTAITAAKAALAAPGSGGTDTPTYAIKSEADLGSGFSSYIASGTYYPVINTSYLSDSIQYTTIENESSEYNGDTVTGVIYGVPEGFTEADIEGMFDLTNCTLTVVTNSQGAMGTGSLAVIKDSSNAVLAIYIANFRGDLNGDGAMDVSDNDAFQSFMSSEEGYMYDNPDEPNRYIFAAVDLNGDGWGDVSDYDGYTDYTLNYVDINQQTGGYFAS